MGQNMFSEYRIKKILNRQTMSAKIHGQKGNSPNYLLRPSKVIK